MKIDIYRDPLLYSAINGGKEDDFPFYLFLTDRVKGPVLELACGTGRLAQPLIEKGCPYTGLDQSVEFIHWCRDHFGDRGTFLLGDMRSFDLGRKFDLIFIGFNAFLHLGKESEALACLTSVYNHLSTSGRFLLDIFVPDPEFLYRDETRLYETCVFDDPRRGSCTIREKNFYDIETGINHIHWYLDWGPEKAIQKYEFDMRMYYPDTMDRLLTETGFVIRQKWGNYEGEPFNDESHLQLYVCSR